MNTIRGRVAALMVGAALFGGSIAATPVAYSAPPAAVDLACKKAKIGGQSKCIAAGQFCAKRYEKDYNRYGYTCNNQDANGRWHLRKR